jgi:cellulose synthase/poly-beta-1,6-N-acetylglucosamine synthase-like glycosyltransferase
VFWYWLFVAPALLLALLSLRGERRRARWVRTRLATAPAGNLPPASVIVPVKGHDDGLRENLAALAALDYPDFEVIVAAQEAVDIPPGVLPDRVRVVLAHGGDSNAGEKVQNLQAAIRAARRRTEVLAFADSDGRVEPGWLKALVAPLGEPGVGASTGFRWFIAEPATFWALVRGAWDAVSAGRLGPGDNPFAWGGAMAIRKGVFAECRVGERWKNVVSDDYALADAIHEAGMTIAYAPGALTPSHGRIRGRAFLAWARRQMTITRRHRPRLWAAALVAHTVYCGAMAASVAAAASGNPAGLWTLAAQLIPGMLKAWRRVSLAEAALGPLKYRWAHTALAPLTTWTWLVVLISSAFGRTIEWRGKRYDLWRAAGG